MKIKILILMSLLLLLLVGCTQKNIDEDNQKLAENLSKDLIIENDKMVDDKVIEEEVEKTCEELLKEDFPSGLYLIKDKVDSADWVYPSIENTLNNYTNQEPIESNRALFYDEGDNYVYTSRDSITNDNPIDFIYSNEEIYAEFNPVLIDNMSSKVTITIKGIPRFTKEFKIKDLGIVTCEKK